MNASKKQILEWMQGHVDYSIMEMWGVAEMEGSAYAGILQRNIRAFIDSAERELGVTLRGADQVICDYWTPEQHNAYHREQGQLEAIGVPPCSRKDHEHWPSHRHASEKAA